MTVAPVFYRLKSGAYRRWPRVDMRASDALDGVPIARCRWCGVAFVRTTVLCPWCGRSIGTTAAATACRHGHALIGRAVEPGRNGSRRCRICRGLSRWAHRRALAAEKAPGGAARTDAA